MLSTYHLGMIKKITPIKNGDFRGGRLGCPCFFHINIHESPADTLFLGGWDARHLRFQMGMEQNWRLECLVRFTRSYAKIQIYCI